ncbi:E3 ubiquitin-protein ligase RAD18 isoform X2 [Cryptotermes secundus]|uniref:E3 ubiquitin-protein ligase RAD18 isoform X2 n=1 Tax=Cryptotermes secundus TaxID=105785 RepID=UPI000CD7D75D|nr:E3 ubiquitin-protein ligase RAD18 isoform X2 [Cryptotermes secundus]
MCEMSVILQNELPVIRDLDALLRCGICYEYMKTSMITTCSHNYCSLCIRKSLMYKSQCPACFAEAFEYQLRNNRILDDIIEVFIILSDEIKSFMQNYGKFSPQNKANTVPDFLQNSNLLSDLRGQNDVISEGIIHDVSSNQKDTRAACGKMSESTDTPTTSSYVSESQNITMTKAELGDVTLPDAASVKQPYPSPDHKRMVSEGDVSIPSIFSSRRKHNTTDNLVPCPVCSIDIPEKNINVHLDACLQRAEQSDQHSSPKKVQKRKPLPKLVYSLLQDRELRKILRQHGLSTHGDRKALIIRHQRFTLLYNSDSDTLNPRSTADIIKQIEREEQEEKKVCMAANTSNKLKIDRKMDPKLIEQAQQQYIHQNKTSFEKLIQSIREREAEKKTSVKQNFVINDVENDFEDTVKEAGVQNVVGLRVIMKNCSAEEDSDAIKNEYDLNDHSSSMSSKNVTSMISNLGDKVNHNDNISETTFDVNYEGDTDDTLSPVLGRHTVTDCSRKEIEKTRYEREPSQNLTPDMFEKSLSMPCSKKYSSSVKQSQEVERDDERDAGSSQSFSLLAEQIQALAVRPSGDQHRHWPIRAHNCSCTASSVQR